MLILQFPISNFTDQYFSSLILLFTLQIFLWLSGDCWYIICNSGQLCFFNRLISLHLIFVCKGPVIKQFNSTSGISFCIYFFIFVSYFFPSLPRRVLIDVNQQLLIGHHFKFFIFTCFPIVSIIFSLMFFNFLSTTGIYLCMYCGLIASYYQ